MPSYKSIELTLAENPGLAYELKLLVNKIFIDKCLEWPLTEASQYPKLIALGIISLTETAITIPVNDYLAYGFMLDSGLIESALDDIARIVLFEEKVKNQLKAEPMMRGWFRVSEQIIHLWIKSQNIDKGNDLTCFSDSSSKINNFSSIFCSILLELNLSANAIYVHYRYLSTGQTSILPLMKVIELYCKKHPIIAIELYDYTQRNPFEDDIHLRLAAQSGLNLNDWFSFLPSLQVFISQGENQLLALGIMFRADIINEKQANHYLDLTLSCDFKNIDIHRNIANVVQQILRFPEILSSTTTDRCFGLLISLSQSELVSVQNSVFDSLFYISGFDNERYNILLKLINNPTLDSSFKNGKNNSIDKLLSSSFQSSKYWFSIYDLLISQNALEIDVKDYQGSIYYLLTHDHINFMNNLMIRLIHSQGLVRFGASKLIDYISHNAPHLRFSKDEFNKLSYLQQYKLWISINSSYRNPSFTIPLLSYIFDSSDELLIYLIIGHLEIMSENFMGEVIEALDKVCNINNLQHQKIYKATKEHFESFIEHRQSKISINELNPYLTQYKLFKQFNDFHSEYWNDKIQNSIGKEGISSIFKKIILSKGGGWKDSKTGTTSQLGQVQTKMNLPRFSFLSPLQMDLEFNFTLHEEDWTEDIDLLTWITQK